MTSDFQLLLITATSLGFIHTILGPDHYLPFIMIGKARNWSISRVLSLTFICGVGHVLSSVIIGLLGIAIGSKMEDLVHFEGIRGNLAAWGLIAFGLAYAIWGIRHWYRRHDHNHRPCQKKSLTPWFLFIIFVLGPCEVLIPVLMYPAANESIGALITVSAVFGISTLLTMLASVLVATYGLSFLPFKAFERFSHSIAGLLIFLSGLAIQILGL
jgi:sulfite exporter TauE/SafE